MSYIPSAQDKWSCKDLQTGIRDSSDDDAGNGTLTPTTTKSGDSPEAGARPAKVHLEELMKEVLESVNRHNQSLARIEKIFTQAYRASKEENPFPLRIVGWAICILLVLLIAIGMVLVFRVLLRAMVCELKWPLELV